MKAAINILKVIMVPAVLIYPLYFNILGGLAFNQQSEIYLLNETITSDIALTMQIWSGVMFVSSALFVSAMILAICKFNLISVFLDIGGMALCIISALNMSSITKAYEMEMYIIRPMTDRIMLNHLPSLIPFFAILIVGIIQNIINDNAMGPDWKEYKSIRAEHKKLLKEAEMKKNGKAVKPKGKKKNGKNNTGETDNANKKGSKKSHEHSEAK